MNNNAMLPVAAGQAGAIAVAPRHNAMLALNSIEELEKMGKIIAASNLFGLAAKGDSPETVAAKGIVVAGLCQQEGISYMEFMRKYHFVNGKVDMRTDAMLAEFQRLGGTYSIQQSDAEGSVATFSFHGTSFQEKVIWKELCENPEPPFFEQVGANKWMVRDNYAKPRKRSQMLWARCVSNGIRKVCPMVNMGVYTPEETVEFVDAALAPVSASPAAATTSVETAIVEVAAPAKATTSRKAAPRKAKKAEPETVDVESAAAADEAQPAASAPEPAPAPHGAALAISFPVAAGDDPEQYAICPCEGKAKGMRWDAISTANLQQIVAAYDNPDVDRKFFTGMTDDHAAYIRAVLATREQEGK